MKTIGLLGGMSWESTVTYYQLLNQMTREKLGGLHSAKIILHSFDFAEIEKLQANDDWDAATTLLSDAARRLELAGADCLVIATNTMHKMAPAVQSAIGIPLLHIADATADAINQSSVQRPLLLATRYTMEQDFYTGRLRQQHNIDVQIPDQVGRDMVHRVIYDELCQGIVSPDSKSAYLQLVDETLRDGADGVIFGCTEVGLLLSATDINVPSFDTTAIHASAALEFVLS